MSENDLTPEETRAMASLPRERRPGDLLEERIVKDLKRRGFLHGRPSRGVFLTPLWTAAAAVLVMALILGGYVVGQWSGSRQTERAMLAMHASDNLRLAMEVQKSGTAYLSALAELMQQAGEDDPEAQRQGREVALTTLYAAAEEMINLFPDDPVAGNILRAMDGAGQSRTSGQAVDPRHQVAWF
jgi:hypothetical protein